MTLQEALNIKSGGVISLVGGGGKTTLMFALARELASAGNHVITTTTTKINYPSSSESPLVILNVNEKQITQSISGNLAKFKHITIAGDKMDVGKLKGISPEFVDRLAELDNQMYMIVEADGAAHRPLKAPNNSEPVIPRSSSLVIAVIGVDAVGCQLNEKNVFRSEIVSKLLGLRLNEKVTVESIAVLATHPDGLTKYSPKHARIVVFINKVDTENDLSSARDLAAVILSMGHPQIERIVLGQAQSMDPIKEVVVSDNS